MCSANLSVSVSKHVKIEKRGEDSELRLHVSQQGLQQQQWRCVLINGIQIRSAIYWHYYGGVRGGVGLAGANSRDLRSMQCRKSWLPKEFDWQSGSGIDFSCVRSIPKRSLELLRSIEYAIFWLAWSMKIEHREKS